MIAECYKYFPIEMAVFPQRMVSASMTQLEDILSHEGFIRYAGTFKFMTLGTHRVTFTGVNRVSTMTVTVPIAVTKGGSLYILGGI